MEAGNQFLQLISGYKYAGIYAFFVIDTLGVFLPSKTILTITGVLVQAGRLSFPPLFLSALAGSLSGFCISYTIGIRVGKPFFQKYGRFLRISPSGLEKAENWFNRFGPAFIIVAYFTPGLRHITPYLSGIAGMSFYKAIAFAAAGAALWITTFVSLGRFFGGQIGRIGELLDRYQWQAVILALLAASLALAVRMLTAKKKKG